MSRYRIHAVAELCGVPAPTLRAWERRYGVPQPARTRSAYRVYSDEDVEVVRRMRDLVATGVAAADAARLLADGAAPPAPSLAGADPFADAADRIVEATIALDVDRLEAEVARALVLGSALAVFDNTFSPAMRRVGELWHEDRISLAHEHVASQVIGATVTHLVRLVQPGEGAPVAVLACGAEEDHVLPLLGVALRFASWGFRAVVLGARTPAAALAVAVTKLQPDVVALSFTSTPTAGDDGMESYARVLAGRPWIAGGSGAEAKRDVIESAGGLCVTAPLDVRVRRALERAVSPAARSRTA